ncbi:MAG: GNAT family N-acetyltransferase [Acidimicrobiia bacterium]|nr:GNAT family N-acetyltransferase [Acidimicrobiia bacterium]
MTEAGLIAEVEDTAYRAWPAKEMAEYDGWQLRYADGFSRRGNSVYPAHRSAIDVEQKLDWCRSWFAERGLGLVVRQNPVTEAGLDDILAGLGYGAEGRTNVMVADLAPAGTASSALALAGQEAWLTAAARLWGIGSDRVAGWRGIVERIDFPTAYALVAELDVPVAVGLGVVADGWLGVFEVKVAKDRRQRGLGRELTKNLMAWGAEHGASRSFLQVVEDNTPAMALYEGLGYRTLYTYWYRRSPRSIPA